MKTYGPLLVWAAGNVAAGTKRVAVGRRASNREIQSCAIKQAIDTVKGLLGVAEGVERVVNLGLSDTAARSLVDCHSLGNGSLGHMRLQGPVPVWHTELVSGLDVGISLLSWVSLSETLGMADKCLLKVQLLALFVRRCES